MSEIVVTFTLHSARRRKGALVSVELCNLDGELIKRLGALRMQPGERVTLGGISTRDAFGLSFTPGDPQ